MLELGDRVRVVGPTLEMPKISKWMGDSAKGLTEINPIALGLGLALGIFIQELPIPLPGGAGFSIGAAAGAHHWSDYGPYWLIAGHYRAAQYRNLVLGELGLRVPLAQAGSNAGGQISVAFTFRGKVEDPRAGIRHYLRHGSGLYVTMRKMFKMGGTKLGLIRC